MLRYERSSESEWTLMTCWMMVGMTMMMRLKKWKKKRIDGMIDEDDGGDGAGRGRMVSEETHQRLSQISVGDRAILCRTGVRGRSVPLVGKIINRMDF